MRTYYGELSHRVLSFERAESATDAFCTAQEDVMTDRPIVYGMFVAVDPDTGYVKLFAGSSGKSYFFNRLAEKGTAPIAIPGAGSICVERSKPKDGFCRYTFTPFGCELYETDPAASPHSFAEARRRLSVESVSFLWPVDCEGVDQVGDRPVELEFKRPVRGKREGAKLDPIFLSFKLNGKILLANTEFTDLLDAAQLGNEVPYTLSCGAMVKLVMTPALSRNTRGFHNLIIEGWGSQRMFAVDPGVYDGDPSTIELGEIVWVVPTGSLKVEKTLLWWNRFGAECELALSSPTGQPVTIPV